ncbi:MAG TPA: helix-turn-helix domain-containing protein [Bryobacteraceae bacterium]|nr:helix-turn-helix domain-containing protein [Bryobacteraceae bacterium]
MQNEDESVLGLATIRRNRGISLEQIAESTKINIRSLKAIEGGDFSKLPGGIYNTSYIRQYAKAIDFDEAELLAFYRVKMGTSNPSEEAKDRSNRKSLIGGGFRPASIIS